jgi:hypothetical protein
MPRELIIRATRCSGSYPRPWQAGEPMNCYIKIEKLTRPDGDDRPVLACEKASGRLSRRQRMRVITARQREHRALFVVIARASIFSDAPC